MAVYMSAYQCPDRAYIQAGCTAHALISLLEYRVLGCLKTAVIQNDNVLLAVFLHHLALVILVDDLGRAVHHGHVAGHALAGTIARQQAENLGSILGSRNQLLIADEHYVDSRQGSYQAGIALIGNQTNGTVLGNTEVGTGDAHVCLQELLAEILAGQLNHVRDILARHINVQLLLEHLRTLIAVQMDSRHNHVGWLLPLDGDHPLAQVCLLHADVMVPKALIEVNFLRCHGLGLYYALYVVFLADLDEVFLYCIAILGAEDMSPSLFEACLELISQLVDMLHCIVLHGTEALPEPLNILSLVSVQAGTRILLCKLGQSALHNIVLEFCLYFLFQITLCHD